MLYQAVNKVDEVGKQEKAVADNNNNIRNMGQQAK